MVSDGYGSTRATTTWISSDGTVTNHDQDTEMGFWVRLLHNECDRSASLEREIERLREERLQWFVVARQLRDALFGTEEKDAAVDEYLRTRGRLEDPREQATG